MRTILSAVIFLLVSSFAQGQISLPRILGDGMVLQRGQKATIFGWASPEEAVQLTFKGRTLTTMADASGNWSIALPPQEAGGPHEIVVAGKNKITISDVFFGDVWICSGQSNMELEMRQVREKYKHEIANAGNTHVRQFLVPDRYNFKESQRDLSEGSWKEVDPTNILRFSAVAYFFSKELYKEYNVPIGLINAALGGSPAEAWMSQDALQQFPVHLHEAIRFRSDSLIHAIEASDRARFSAWYAEMNRKDPGTGTGKWHSAGLDDSSWKNMSVPGYWNRTEIGDRNGAVWFRRTIEVGAAMAGGPAVLKLGRMVDQDSVFINGKVVGTTGYQYPQRSYEVQPGILNPGKNVIAIRLINNSGAGGFVPGKPYFLANATDTIRLDGPWKYKVGAEMPPLEGQTFIRWKPSGLFNAMISPLLNLSVRGVIWYQGESNAGRAQEYARLFPALIRDWRNKWGVPDLPFIFVQLPNFMDPKPIPSESSWAELRQVQWKTLSLPNTGMAVITDLGEWNDIHPLNKKDVGRRLALQARKVAYHESDLIASGPEPASARFKNNEVIITFKNIGKRLQTKDGNQLNHFALSSDGKTFTWADARIEGAAVIVSGKNTRAPKVVRYAWADNPDTANLVNSEGLPATPFELRKE